MAQRARTNYEIFNKLSCGMIDTNVSRENRAVPRVHDVIVLVDSSEPFIGEDRRNGSQVGGR